MAKAKKVAEPTTKKNVNTEASTETADISANESAPAVDSKSVDPETIIPEQPSDTLLPGEAIKPEPEKILVAPGDVDDFEKEPEAAEPVEPPLEDNEIHKPEDKREPEPEPVFVEIVDLTVIPKDTLPKGGQFVIGLSAQLPVGTKIHKGKFTFVVDYSSGPVKSEVDRRKNQHQTLVRQTAGGDLDFEKVLAVDDQWEVL